MFKDGWLVDFPRMMLVHFTFKFLLNVTLNPTLLFLCGLLYWRWRLKAGGGTKLRCVHAAALSAHTGGGFCIESSRPCQPRRIQCSTPVCKLHYQGNGPGTHFILDSKWQSISLLGSKLRVSGGIEHASIQAKYLNCCLIKKKLHLKVIMNGCIHPWLSFYSDKYSIMFFCLNSLLE